ncbi:hypothetical protein EV102420_38_00160 [Pseudescherichia vulneris NBRC 102420]|uniref:Uncharacterized protein n=1 Tax=Pseudescherichia vulneris NBRC 102420 TaxID=1115515 RepID=A0A090V8C2_PSEVU|nr:hypothetical protein [Pseudescherichia vulneris]GAL60413.1 hypothetical protein EV102420_38_00160 [Pseudescherichia vulneris NBRC 102420]
MAGLTKEQRAQREAERLAAAGGGQNNPEQEQEQEQALVIMRTEFPAFPGAPDEADVHPDEVENWKAAGWIVKE